MSTVEFYGKYPKDNLPRYPDSPVFKVNMRADPASARHFFQVVIDDRWFVQQVLPAIVRYVSDSLINQMAQYLGEQALQRIEMNKEKMLDQIVMKARTRRFRLETK